MKPFEEADHLLSIFRQLESFRLAEIHRDVSGKITWKQSQDSVLDQQLKLVERVREIAIAFLVPITPQDYDLKNFDHAVTFCLESLHKLTAETIPFQGALKLLRTCTDALESGKVNQNHIENIVNFYRGLDKRVIGGAIGRANRIINAEEKKEKARNLAIEILATHKNKLTIKGLWRSVALKLNPDLSLSEEDLRKAVDNLRNQNKDLKPSV